MCVEGTAAVAHDSTAYPEDEGEGDEGDDCDEIAVERMLERHDNVEFPEVGGGASASTHALEPGECCRVI